MIAILRRTPTWNNVGSPKGVANLRVELQLSGSDWVIPLRTTLVENLKDLIVNGDSESEDTFLNAIDGEEKLGKSLSKFIITSAILERVSGSVTVYFRFYAEFDGEPAPIRNVAGSKTVTV